MLSFGTCNGNRGGFTVCAVKNNLGILVVVFTPKRTRFELSVYVFKTTIMHGAEKMYQALLFSATSKQQEERIRGPDSQADY